MNARFLKSAKNPKIVKNLIGHDPISSQFFVRAYFCGHFDTLFAGKALKREFWVRFGPLMLGFGLCENSKYYRET